MSKKREDVDIAYELQKQAGIRGGARWTTIGVGVLTTAHCFWPRFARQTLALKGFLLSGFFVWGMVTEAERALLAYEQEFRANESAIRREARLDLARRGLIGTETEIAKWKAERQERIRAEQDAAAAVPSSTSNDK